MSFLKNVVLSLGVFSVGFFGSLSAAVIEADDSNFADVFPESGRCIVNFYSDSVKDSRKFSRDFESVSNRYRRLIKFIAVDTQLSFYTNERFNVVDVPTAVFFMDGVEIFRIDERVRKKELTNLIREVY